MPNQSRELDALVAEKVFGYWDVQEYEGQLVHGESNMNGWPMDTPHYSTDIAAAWLVIDKLANSGIPGHVGRGMLHLLRACAGDGWEAQFCSDFGYTPTAIAPTAPLAICRAALAAVENMTNAR